MVCFEVNNSLKLDYCKLIGTSIVSDYGEFSVLSNGEKIASHK